MNQHGQVIELLKEHFKGRLIIGIEIGAAEALLSKGLLLYLPNLIKMYAIDPYKYIPGGQYEASVGSQEWHDDRKRQAEVALAVYKERACLLSITSDEAVFQTPSEVDFVWVDGDHTLTQVKLDVENYYPKVCSGGIFGGHDYNLVKSVLESQLVENIYTGVDLTWWVIKK